MIKTQLLFVTTTGNLTTATNQLPAIHGNSTRIIPISQSTRIWSHILGKAFEELQAAQAKEITHEEEKILLSSPDQTLVFTSTVYAIGDRNGDYYTKALSEALARKESNNYFLPVDRPTDMPASQIAADLTKGIAAVEKQCINRNEETHILLLVNEKDVELISALKVALPLQETADAVGFCLGIYFAPQPALVFLSGLFL